MPDGSKLYADESGWLLAFADRSYGSRMLCCWEVIDLVPTYDGNPGEHTLRAAVEALGLNFDSIATGTWRSMSKGYRPEYPDPRRVR